MTTRPWPLWRFQRRSMAGISSLQGSHQVAQRLRKTTLPLKSARLSVPPSSAATLKSLACCGRLGLMRSSARAGSSAAPAGSAAQTRNTKTCEAKRHMAPRVYTAPARLSCVPAFMVGYRASMAVTIIADDLTGACDAGALFAGRGPVGVFVTPDLPDARLRAAAGLEARLRGGRVFKKIDSTVRGNVAAELEALMSATDAMTALVSPAFPGQGRTVIQGFLSVHGVLAHEGPVGRDADYPGASSDL